MLIVIAAVHGHLVGASCAAAVLEVCYVQPSRRTDQTLVNAARVLNEAETLSSQEIPPILKTAITKYRSVLTLSAKGSGPEYLQIRSQALVGIGRAENDLHQAKSALDYLEQAVTISTNHLATRVAARVELARTYMALGRPIDAMATAKAGLADAELSGDKSSRALAHTSLADLHYELNEYERARFHAECAREIFESLGNQRAYAHTLITLGLIASDLSNSEKAMSLYTQTLAISRVVNYRAGITDALTFSGHVCAKEGRLQEAIEYYLAAGDSARELGDLLRESWITSGLAYVYEQSGDSTRALEYYRRTLALRLQVDNLPAEASIYKRLGTSYAAIEDFDHAEKFFLRAISLYQHFNQSRFLFIALRDLAGVYENSGRYSDAAEYYNRAKLLLDKAEDPRGHAYLLEGLARLAERNGQLEIASQTYSAALALHRASRDRRGESEAMYRLAMLAAKQGQLDRALRQIDDTLKNDETFRSEIYSPDLRASYLSDVRKHYEARVDLLMQLYKTNSKAADIESAFEASEHIRARSLLESMQDARGIVLSTEDSALGARAEQLKNQLLAKANQRAELISRGTIQSVNALNDEINQLSDDYERIQSLVRARVARTSGFESPKLLTTKEVQQALDEDVALVEYMLGDELSYAWVITTNSIAGVELPRRKTIEAAARDLYELISNDGSHSVQSTQSKELSDSLNIKISALNEMILRPVVQRVRARRIAVVADGALQLVPFAALNVSKDGIANQSPPISSYEFVSLPSASVISVLRQNRIRAQSSAKTLVVLADPVFSPDDPRVKLGTRRGSPQKEGIAAQTTQTLRDAGLLDNNGELPRLLASGWEADSIIAVVGQSATKATGFNASLTTALGPQLRQYQMIHMATHAVLNTQRPALSGIVLSLFDERGRPQPGYLRAIDIYGMDLSAELVTLSACQTAIGREFKGEGMVGLSRAFMQAGTKRVVASLWKVNDSATAALMSEFYKEMFTNKQRPAAALRQAQLTISQQKRWRSPYYWAGFVLQGEWR